MFTCQNTMDDVATSMQNIHLIKHSTATIFFDCCGKKVQFNFI